ncbi:MAG: THUMP domain-containing class I SAM-dependent RNA methyltransferase [Burkholderiaceae bacterium]|nr:class I SAM-dependent RNA methyltransferase [Betaproteobacteria bacterium]
MTQLSAFAVCPSGLEACLAQELSSIEGVGEVQAGKAGCWFRADATAIARANLWCRTPTRILLMLDQLRLRSADDLYAAAKRLPWEKFLHPAQTIRIDVNQGRPAPFELALPFAGFKVKDGLCDRLRDLTGERPSVDTRNPDIRIWVYIDGDKATLSIDTSGEPLFKRGWRLAKGEAPLRENLAAALVQMTGLQPVGATTPSPQVVIDPMAGSGTLLIEAASLLAGLAPGFHPTNPRRFACEDFNKASPFGRVDFIALRAACAAAWAKATGLALPTMVGRDLDERLVRVAKENAARALPPAISEQLTFELADFFQAAAPSSTEAPEPTTSPNLLITNLPYGKRVQMTEDEPRKLSETLKRHYAGYQAWLLTDNLKLDSAIRLKAGRRIPVFNGDIECRWMRFDMVAGSARRERPSDQRQPGSSSDQPQQP